MVMKELVGASRIFTECDLVGIGKDFSSPVSKSKKPVEEPKTEDKNSSH